MIAYLIASILIAAAAFAVRQRTTPFPPRRALLRRTGGLRRNDLFGGLYGQESTGWFRFDAPGTLFYVLLCIVSAFAYFHSEAYLRDNDLAQTGPTALVMLLTTAITGPTSPRTWP